MTENTTANSSSTSVFRWGEIQKHWKWHLVLGFLFVVMGSIGLVVTPLATLSTVLLFASFMLAGGLAQLFEAIKATKGWKSRIPHLLGGILYIAAGIVAAWNPLAASLVLTIILAAAILAIGIFRVIVAFQHRQEMGDWGLLLISGIVSIVIALLIGFSWPYSALWTLGLFISIEMIFNGWSQILIALAAKKKASEKANESGADLQAS